MARVTREEKYSGEGATKLIYLTTLSRTPVLLIPSQWAIQGPDLGFAPSPILALTWQLHANTTTTSTGFVGTQRRRSGPHSCRTEATRLVSVRAVGVFHRVGRGVLASPEYERDEYNATIVAGAPLSHTPHDQTCQASQRNRHNCCARHSATRSAQPNNSRETYMRKRIPHQALTQLSW
jgi:hypothetical protein